MNTEDKFVATENTFVVIPCNTCAYHKGGLSCTAFEVIPDEILLGENPHTEVLEDQDNPIVYTKRKNINEPV